MSDLKGVCVGTGVDLMIKMTSLGGNQKAFLSPHREKSNGEESP